MPDFEEIPPPKHLEKPEFPPSEAQPEPSFDMPPPLEETPMPEVPKAELPDFPEIPQPELKPETQAPHMPEEEIIKEVNQAKEQPEMPVVEEHAAPTFTEPPITEEWHEEEIPHYEAPPHREIVDVEGPLFILSTQYQRVLGRTNTIKDLLKHSADRLVALSEIRIKEEKQLKSWKRKLEDMQRKLIYIDRKVFNTEG